MYIILPFYVMLYIMLFINFIKNSMLMFVIMCFIKTS